MASPSTFRGVWLRTLWMESEAPPHSGDDAFPTDAETGMAVVDAFDGTSKLKSYALWTQSPPLQRSPQSEPAATNGASSTPSRAYFSDVRCVPQVAGKFGQRRWFAGGLEVTTPTTEEQKEANALFASFLRKRGEDASSLLGGADVPSCRLTWHRDIDSLPESCPAGVDSAMCFLVPPKGWLTTTKATEGHESSLAHLTWASLVEGASNLAAEGGRWTVVEAGDGYWEEWERIAFWPGEGDGSETNGPSSASATLVLATDSNGAVTDKVGSLDFNFVEVASGLGELLGGEAAEAHICVSRTAPSVVELNFAL